MSNKEKIQEVAGELGLTIGCYDELIDTISQQQLKKILENIEYQSDTDITIKRKAYVVEIDIADTEVDFNVLTKNEYIDRYGDERYEES